MVKRRALEVVAEPDSNTNAQTNAAEVMRILDLDTDVADLARSVIGDTRSTGQQLRRAAEAWLATQGESAVPEIAALATGRPAQDHVGRAGLAAFLHKAGDGKTAESLATAVLEDELADGAAVATSAEILLSVCGSAAVPRVVLAVDRWSGCEQVWHAAQMLKHLAAYPEAAVISRIRVLLEQWVPSGYGAHKLIEAWLAVEPAGEPVLSAIDRGAPLGVLDLGWTAQHLLDAGERGAAIELAERALRLRHGRRSGYQQAASVLLKADRAAAISQLTFLAAQNSWPAWLAGIIDAFEPPDLDTERACASCAQQLVTHPRSDSKELCDALHVLLFIEGETVAHAVAEAAWTRPELSFYQRRQLACMLAAVGQLGLACSVLSHLLEWQGYAIVDDVGLVDDFLNAGVEQWAEERIHELIDDPAIAPMRVHRLRQMLAWLTVGADRSAPSTH